MSQPILVIGSTGKTGRRVHRRLVEAGHDVRGAARGTDPGFDWEDPSTWSAALAGVGTAYVTYAPDLAAPGAPAAIEALVKEATAAGVRRLVLLSGRGEAGARACEEIVLGSGLEATVVRASWFAQNFSEGPLLDSVRDGVVALPVEDVPEPFVDVDDIADVAVAALTGEGHAGRVYEVSGPRLLTFAEAMAEIARAAGRPVTYVPISGEDFHEALLPIVGADHADLLRGLFEELFDGRNAALADGVREALGRPPRDFADYCAEVAATGAWSR